MTSDLIEAVRSAHRNGYAHATARPPAELPNGTRRYEITDGSFAYEDVFAGGNPYAGWELLTCDRQPVWAMSYYGAATERPAEVFAALRIALRSGLADGEWCRGPATLHVNDLEYTFAIDGDFNAFTAREQLTTAGTAIYQATFVGGLVDHQAAL